MVDKQKAGDERCSRHVPLKSRAHSSSDPSSHEPAETVGGVEHSS